MVVKSIKQEPFFFAIFFMFIILTILYPDNIKNYPELIDWNTIFLITGLLIITNGMKESGYFYIISSRLLKRIRNERELAIFIIFLSSLLSTFLTNDVALLIVVPLTLAMQDIISGNIIRLLVFETIAANVGSTLTPIGNPQNIFIWQKWHLMFHQFVFMLFPLFILLFSILLIFAFFVFLNKRLQLNKKNEYKSNKLLFISSFLFLIYVIISAEFGFLLISFLITIVFYLLFYRHILKKLDWILPLIFILVFIDFNTLSNITLIHNAVKAVDLSAKNVFMLSAILSQLISNVPAAIFLSDFTSNWKAIAYGVNIGGNGIIIASLANIITIRIARKKKLWILFHKYSIPYFMITAVMAYFLFF